MCDVSWVSHKKAEKRGGGFSASESQSYSKLSEMDRSSVKKISLVQGGGAFLPAKPKVTQNCLKWIDPV